MARGLGANGFFAPFTSHVSFTRVVIFEAALGSRRRFVTSEETYKRLDRDLEAAHRHARTTHGKDTRRTSPSTMTSVTSTDDDTSVDTASLVERERKLEKACEALRSEFDAFMREVVERVRGLEARVEAAETQRDAMRAELEATRRTLEEAKATRGGYSSLFHQVISTTYILSPEFLPEPADLGRLRAVSKDMREAVDATGREIKKISNEKAEELGYLSLLKDRHSRGLLPKSCWPLMIAAAARNGDLEELKAFRAEMIPWDRHTCSLAAKGGHLEVLKWAHENGCPWDKWTCSCAANGGHLEMLKWARENGCPWDERTCMYAVDNGHLEVLIWARENGCPWDKDYTCVRAASGGHLEVLQWLRENGCPWDERTCARAANGGHLKVLKWAHENGCPWNERTCVRAASGGHLEVLIWAREKGCPWDKWTCHRAAEYAEWCPFEYGRFDVLQWAREKGCPWDERTRRLAAQEGYVES